MSKKSIIREIFSGANGKLSAKRVIGGLAMFVALGCTIYLVIRDGSNDVVENLLMTIFITSVSLLGLPAVTGIWGKNSISVGRTPNLNNEHKEQSDECEEQSNEDDPCKNCPYNKNL